MAPRGTAVAVWEDLSGNGISRSFNGSVWEAPLQFTSDVSNDLDVSVNSSGNALVIWASSEPQIKSSRLPLGGVWGPEEILQSNPPHPEISDITSSLSATGIGFATWRSITEGDNIGFADATLPPTPPSNLRVISCKDHFAIQADCANTITWTPSTDPTVVDYFLRRNDVLIAVIPARDRSIFIDQGRCRRVDVYTLTAVDRDGVESSPLIIVIK